MNGHENEYKRIMKALKEKEESRRKEEKRQYKKYELPETIDMLLDEYNDYMALYQMFGDQEYKNKANLAMEKLQIMTMIA